MSPKLSTHCLAAITLMATLTGATPALAWSNMDCGWGGRVQYPYDNVWELRARSSLAPGSTERAAIDAAIAMWNDVAAAEDALEIEREYYGACAASSDNAGFGVISYDDGTCYDWSNEGGVTSYYTRGCDIAAINVYLRAKSDWTQEQLTHTAMHELGHYLTYAHNWYEVSVMGYAETAMAMVFLTAPDHAFMRGTYGTGGSALPDLHIHRFITSPQVVPDRHSYRHSLAYCSSGSCMKLRHGDTISIALTYGNAGMQDARDVEIRMYLGEWPVGSWDVARLDAHAQATMEFEVTVPEEVPAGRHDLVVKIDPDDRIRESEGPTAGNTLTIDGFKIKPPEGWTCNEFNYDADDGCHCNCGVLDPDCDDARQEVLRCEDSNPCTQERCSDAGECVNDAAVLDGTACDPGDLCRVDAVCDGGECRSRPTDCSALESQCVAATCDPATGACVQDAASRENSSCDDGQFCTEGDVCRSGECVGIERDCAHVTSACVAAICREDIDQCLPDPQALHGQPCDDGDWCTVQDYCNDGVCVATPRDCGDDDPCTHDYCVPDRGCFNDLTEACGGTPGTGTGGTGGGDTGGAGAETGSSGCGVAEPTSGAGPTAGGVFLLLLLAAALRARRRPARPVARV